MLQRIERALPHATFTVSLVMLEYLKQVTTVQLFLRIFVLFFIEKNSNQVDHVFLVIIDNYT